MSRFILASVFVVLALAGCGQGPSGSIVEMSYVPAHRANVEVDDYSLICVPSGSSISCTSYYVGSHLEERAFDAQWNAVLVRCSPDFKCRREIVAISKENYETWAIGDYYPAVAQYAGIRSVGR